MKERREHTAMPDDYLPEATPEQDRRLTFILRFFVIALIILLAISMAGCSTFASDTQRITVTVEPKEAEIFIDSIPSGKGTASIMVPRDKNVSVLASLEGCQTMHRSIGHRMSDNGKLDAIGGLFFLIPWIGLASAGSRELEESDIFLSLPCKDKTSFRIQDPLFG